MFLLIISLLFLLSNSQPLYIDYQVQEDYVPILGYHRVEGSVTGPTTTTIADFRDQVDYLTNTLNCNWITMNTLANYIQNEEKIPTNACIMGFDDGISVQYHNVLCSLNTYNIPATFFITFESVSSKGYHLTFEEVDKLYNIGHAIGCHTMSHPHLSTLSYSEQYYEIVQGKVELENLGYQIDVFAIPYGDYNDDTLNILEENFIISRDTSQDFAWKDVRSPTISFNDHYLQQFFYIKPEGYSGEELGNLVEYTGWWQFEDNYKIINGDGNIDISISPTDKSYAVLGINDINTEISTQFITKYIGGFTLDLLLYNSTLSIGFDIKVDDIIYSVYSYNYTHPNSLKYITGNYDFYNFYINIDNLSSGIHTLNVINKNGQDLFLDKFRLFSNVNQDFSYTENYVDCNPDTDDYCECDITPSPTPSSVSSPDPTCANGILSGDICCHSDCGSCGGSGCGARPGGGSNCCGGPIVESGISCNDESAPCVVSNVQTLAPTLNPTQDGQTPSPTQTQESDPTCANGILKGDICCHLDCGTCGGYGCSMRFGGGSNCCGGSIIESGISCNDQTASCIVSNDPTSEPTLNPTQDGATPSPTLTPESDPTCANGILKNDICCHSDCGSCGGSGCGTRPGGGSNCCGGPITESGISCNDSVSPCLVSLQ